MMRGSVAQQPVGGFPATMPAGAQPAGFPMGMHSGPSFAVPTVPIGRREARIIYRKYPTLQQR